MKPKTLIHSLLFGLVLLACACFSDAQTVVPLGGLGAVQVFDNNGNECTACVLYTYQAGTVTQQATYTDFTAQTPNTNPVTFSSGGRSTVWLLSGAYYKFILCLQNDGAYCAPADVLFSVDQVLAGSGGSGGGGGSSPYTGTFISGSANPATSGILELASGDSICWRNAAGTSNFCLSKDSNDILTWPEGSMKMTEISCPTVSIAGFDLLCANSTAHRLWEGGNGGSMAQIVVATQDINLSDQVTQVHFGSTPAPFSSTAPTPGQYLNWNGAAIVGSTPLVQEVSFGLQVGGGIVPCGTYTTASGCAYTQLTYPHTVTRIFVVLATAPVGCSTNAVVGIKDITAGAVLMSLSPTAVGISTTTGSVAIPAGHDIGVGLLVAPAGCSTYPLFGSVNAVYQ